MKNLKWLAAACLAALCMSAQAVNTVKVYFAFTPFGTARLSALGMSPSDYVTAVVTMFNQAAADSGGGPYFAITPVGSPGTTGFSRPGPSLAVVMAMQDKLGLVFGHDHYGSDIQVVVDATGTLAPSIGGGLGDTGSHPWNAFVYLNLSGLGTSMSPVQVAVHEIGHVFGAAHEDDDTSTARSYTIKLPYVTDAIPSETNCHVYESVMNRGQDDDLMSGAGYAVGTGSVVDYAPGLPAPYFQSRDFTVVRDTPAHACQAYVDQLPTIYSPPWYTDTGTIVTLNAPPVLNSVTTETDFLHHFNCNITQNLHTDYGPGSPPPHYSDFTSTGDKQGSYGASSRAFHCPQLARVNVFSNLLQTWNVPGTGTYLPFGASPNYNAVSNQMITRSGFLKDYHLKKLVPGWLGRYFPAIVTTLQ